MGPVFTFKSNIVRFLHAKDIPCLVSPYAGGCVARILLCGINYAPNLIGVAKYNTELCEWLSEAGHDVKVVTGPPYYPAWKISPKYRSWTYRSEKRNGVSLIRAPIFVPRTPSGTKRLLRHA